MSKQSDRPEVRVKPYKYQPSKAELRDDIRIDAKPEDVIKAAFQQARIVEDVKA